MIYTAYLFRTTLYCRYYEPFTVKNAYYTFFTDKGMLIKDQAGKFISRQVAGLRLQQPKYCPNKVYELLLYCWHVNWKERPDFNKIIDIISTISDDINNLKLRENNLRSNEPFLMDDLKNERTVYNEDNYKCHYDQKKIGSKEAKDTKNGYKVELTTKKIENSRYVNGVDRNYKFVKFVQQEK